MLFLFRHLLCELVQSSLRQFLFQCLLRASKDLRQGGTSLASLVRMEDVAAIQSTIDISKRNFLCRARQPCASAWAFYAFHKTGFLQLQKDTADDDRICVQCLRHVI